MYRVPPTIAKQIMDSYNRRQSTPTPTMSAGSIPTSPSYWPSLTTPIYDTGGGSIGDQNSPYTDQQISDATPMTDAERSDIQSYFGGIFSLGGLIASLSGVAPAVNTAIGLGKEGYDALTGRQSWTDAGKNSLITLGTLGLNNAIGPKGAELGYKVAGIPGAMFGGRAQSTGTKSLLDYLMNSLFGDGDSDTSTTDFGNLGSMGNNFDLGAFNSEPGGPFSSLTGAINSQTDPWGKAGRDISFLGNDPNYRSIADNYTNSLRGGSNVDTNKADLPGEVDSGYYDSNTTFSSPSGLTGDVDQGYYDNGGGSSGGGDSGGTVICTELHRQGLLSDKVYCYDSAFGKTIDIEAYRGYLKLFTPFAKTMAKSKILTFIAAPFGISAAYEMASRVNNEIRGNIIGKAILAIGIPFCKAYWRRANRRNGGTT